MAQLGKLETVDPKTVWTHEAHDFTPWLLEHSDELASALGIDIELSTSEHPVGKFFLDLLGQDLTHGCPLMIENQLTITDHDHLGKLVTYAAGTEARTIIWIATDFREEHRSAIDFLNEMARGAARFFRARLCAARIGDSPPAPLFSVVAKPNDWAAETSTAARATALSGKAPLYQQFWTSFLERLHREHPTWTAAKVPQTTNWISMPAPISGATFDTSFAAKGRLRHGLYIDSGDGDANAAIFAALLTPKGLIEQRYGGELEWEELPDKRACRIAEYGVGDGADVEEHDGYIDWFLDRGERLRAALAGLETSVSAALEEATAPTARTPATAPPAAPLDG